MSEFIQDIPFTDFKELILHRGDDIKDLKSFAVTRYGELLMIVIIPQTDYTKTQAEYLAQLSNSVGGKEVKETVEVT